MKTMLMLCLVFFATTVSASRPYYPDSTLEKFSSDNSTPDELREEIFNLSTKFHIKHNDSNDTLSDICPDKEKCEIQKLTFDYKQARQIMFGELFLENHGNGKYSVKDAYCNINIDETMGAGPDKIPNPKYMNCEHTWPQSKFSKTFSADLQKTDLHHLFPADMRANSTRNNFPFADVDGKATHSNCLDSKIGNATGSDIRSFEPPIEHKGNVARAIYYFSTRYKMNIDATQAKYLKIWNAEDPVDQEELLRNEKIMKLQGNRNPFIDYPELVNRL
ncbi:MAG: endonuclease [Rhizobacter sp.]|nr:endonuclease [Bacteriovorax sp.]